MRIPGGWGAAALLFVLGFGYLVATPPYQAPDEPMHFYRAYRIALGHLVESAQGGKTGGVLPLGVIQSATKLGPVPLPENDRIQFSAVRDFYGSTPSMKEMEAGPWEFRTTPALYSPISYLPQALGVAFARLFDGGLGKAFYLARLFNLLAACALAGLALGLVQASRASFLFFMLSPMAIFQAASASPDALTNALAFLSLCLAAGLMERAGQELSWKQWIALALSALLVLCKSVYVFIALLPLVVIWLWQRSWRQRLLTLLPLALTFAVLAISSVQMRALYGVGELPAGVAPAEQLKHLIGHLWQWPSILLETWNRDGTFLTRSYVGLLGWLDVPLPRWATRTYLAGLFVNLAVLGLARYRAPRGWIVPAAALVAFAGAGSAIVLALYLGWTPVGQPSVNGLQGRYFIPLLPILLLVLGPPAALKRCITQRASSGIAAALFLIGVSIAAGGFLRLLNRYYGI